MAQPVKHDNYSDANYFGISYHYSAAADTVLWMDDISVSFERVVLPTKISAATPQGQHKIRVSFTQNLDRTTVGEVTNYKFTGHSATFTPVQAVAVNDKEILLTFENPLPRGPATLRVEKLRDENNNEITDETDLYIFYLLYGDVVINEIMAMPTPSVGLPETRYIELYNRLELPVPLNGWKIEYNTTVGNIGTATIPAKGYLILCTSSAVEDMRVFGNTTNITYITSLTKSGKTLQLKNNEGQLLSRVTYSDQWFEDEIKRAGGWSLEKIDANNLSESADNWAASTDARGGTPGAENSVHAVHPDTDAPFVTDLKMLDNQTLSLTFSELFDTTKAVNPLCYTLNNNIGRPQQVLVSTDNPQQITLRFASSFVQGVVYELTLSAPFCDLAGNVPEERLYSFGNLFLPGNNDIVVNEVLFNPPVNGVDFVEIYNRSDKIFDLRQVKLANRNKDNKVAAIQTVSQQYYLPPNEYAVFTTSLDAVRQFYSVPFPEKVIIMKSLPSYPNENGCVVLLDENDEIVDEFLYSEDMHSGFINNPEGVSLERVNPGRPSDERANWQSAAQDIGFATPTYRNSQYDTKEEHASGGFNLPYEVFSPDGDGYNDVLYIDYNVGAAGYVANITIYDTQGRLVKEVEKNALLGVSGRFAWDGARHDNRKAGVGMYIIFIEYFDLNGSVTRLKKLCALAGR
ncbi:MAG: lamin tail domain-containing protein [Prevotellaceae bacterium]|nr:lamin tail domain-containing protein [Prevotellaceae bacterium]